MKLTPSIRHEGFTINKAEPFKIESAIMLGLRFYPAKQAYKNFYGRVAILFIFTSKTNEADLLYTQVLLDIENEEELRYITYHPMNINNFDPQFKKETFDEIIKGANPGVNSYGSNLEFKHEILSVSGYQFECVYTNREEQSETIKTVSCSKGTYLQLSQFMFWIMCCYPIATDIFLDPKYENAKIMEVTSMIFDGSTQTVFLGQKRIMAHFTLYYKDTLGTGQFGFNVPCDILNRIERKPLLEADYIRLYNKDDTILPDRIFNVSSPNKKSMLLSGNPNETFYRFYTLDEETIKKIKWLDWGKHIYMTASERIQNDSNIISS